MDIGPDNWFNEKYIYTINYLSWLGLVAFNNNDKVFKESIVFINY